MDRLKNIYLTHKAIEWVVKGAFGILGAVASRVAPDPGKKILRRLTNKNYKRISELKEKYKTRRAMNLEKAILKQKNNDKVLKNMAYTLKNMKTLNQARTTKEMSKSIQQLNENIKTLKQESTSKEMNNSIEELNKGIQTLKELPETNETRKNIQNTLNIYKNIHEVRTRIENYRKNYENAKRIYGKRSRTRKLYNRFKKTLATLVGRD